MKHIGNENIMITNIPLICLYVSVFVYFGLVQLDSIYYSILSTKSRGETGIWKWHVLLCLKQKKTTLKDGHTWGIILKCVLKVEYELPDCVIATWSRVRRTVCELVIRLCV